MVEPPARMASVSTTRRTHQALGVEVGRKGRHVGILCHPPPDSCCFVPRLSYSFDLVSASPKATSGFVGFGREVSLRPRDIDGASTQ